MSTNKFSTFTNVDYPLTPKVPEHWRALPCRAFVAEKLERNNDGIEREYLSLMSNVGVIRYSEKGDVGNKAPDDLTKCKVVEKGNLVINSMNYSIGSYGISPYNGVCSPVYIVLEPITSVVSRRFALRIFENKEFQNWAQSFGSGILAHRAAIGWDDLKNIIVGIPPLGEQQKIAQFLDYETAKIDALIDEQKRLIELLKEKRQAVISHAVTKGLNPDVPMKDSGVEWLGQVPEHWGIQKLANLTIKIGSGKTPKGGALSYVDSGIKLIRSQNVYDDGLRLDDIAYITPEVDAEMHWSRTQAGDILINITGGSIGRTCIISKAELPANVNQHVCIIRLDKQLSGYLDWTALFLKSVLIKEQINFYQTGSGREGLNFEQLSNFRVPLPPLSEAQDISEHLTRELSVIEQLNARARLCSDLLKERRSALISAAVTGKIDVRDWQPPKGSDRVESQLEKVSAHGEA